MSIAHRTTLLLTIALSVCLAVLIASIYGFSQVDRIIASGASAPEAASGIANLHSSIDHAKVVVWYSAVFGILMLLGMGFLFWRAVVIPIRHLQAAITVSADNMDFTQVLRVVSNDEIGLTLKAYNSLLTNLRNSLQSIQKETEHLTEITEDVDASARRIARNSQVQSDASTNMSTSVEQMATGISLAAEQALNAREHTRESREVAERGTGDILNTVTGIQGISESVGKASTHIKALRDDCNSIAKMAIVIHQIADQTNVLALNAAIEAAHAGEQGRGFSVVADEVLNLALRTTESTQEIRKLLVRMQDSAHVAVESMTATEAEVSKGVANARRAGMSIDRINQGSINAANTVENIFTSIRDQQIASTDIAKKIEQISLMTEQNTQASIASARAIGTILQAGQDISRILSPYKIHLGMTRIVLRVAEMHGEEHPVVRALKNMSQFLEQRTEGRISLKIYPSGRLGHDSEVLEQVRCGHIDIMRANPTLLNKMVPATLLLGLPFLFRSIEHMHSAVDGRPGQQILAACASAGLIGLAYYDSGARSIYGNKPIRSLADANGLRLRVMPSDLWVTVAKAMGTLPVQMVITEMVAAQKMGLIDAAENNIPTFDGFKQHEVFKCFSHTEHVMLPELIVFSKTRWDTLAPEDQVLIAEAARDSVPLMRQYWAESENIARRNSIEAGTTFITDVDKVSFQSAMKPVYDEVITTQELKELLLTIQAIR